jgi:Flp pilus assembly protein TadB
MYWYTDTEKNEQREANRMQPNTNVQSKQATNNNKQTAKVQHRCLAAKALPEQGHLSRREGHREGTEVPVDVLVRRLPPLQEAVHRDLGNNTMLPLGMLLLWLLLLLLLLLFFPQLFGLLIAKNWNFNY